MLTCAFKPLTASVPPLLLQAQAKGGYYEAKDVTLGAKDRVVDDTKDATGSAADSVNRTTEQAKQVRCSCLVCKCSAATLGLQFSSQPTACRKIAAQLYSFENTQEIWSNGLLRLVVSRKLVLEVL